MCTYAGRARNPRRKNKRSPVNKCAKKIGGKLWMLLLNRAVIDASWRLGRAAMIKRADCSPVNGGCQSQ